MSMRRVWLFVPLWACFVACVEDGSDAFAGDAGTAAFDARPRIDAGPRPDDLDGFVQWEMRAHGVPGLAAVIVKDDAPVWIGTFGYADIDAEAPVTEETLFAVASISKTVVTVPVMQLVERGLLDLDAPVDDYLPYAVRHPAFPDRAVTTRMLLTHTSGIEDDFVTLADAIGESAPPMTLHAFGEAYVTPGGALYTESNWGAAPGTRWSYSNAAYGLVGHVVEVVGGASVAEQTASGLRAPLGLDASGWLGFEVPASALATGYTWNGRAFTALDYQLVSFYPASNWVTSLAELTRYLRAFIRLGALDGARILEEATVNAMREPQVPAIWDGQGITWRYSVENGQRWLGHSGATLGGSANMLFRPADGAAIILLTNSDAYVLARLGLTETSDALGRILDRLVVEADGL